MAYQLTEGDTILRLADRATIPAVSGNVDYENYLEWVAEGNSPLPAPKPAPPKPQTPLDKLMAAGLTVADLRALLADDPAPAVESAPADGVQPAGDGGES